MIWVGILEIGFAVMLSIAVIVAIVRDYRHWHDAPETEDEQRCEMCKFSERIYEDEECVYMFCDKYAETVTSKTWCEEWEKKDDE